MSNPISLVHALKLFVEGMLGGMHTCIPAQVQSYNPTKSTVDAQPVVTYKRKDGTIVPYPLLTSVPVIFPRTRRGSFTIPLESGDYVLLIFSERSLDTWLNNGNTVETESPSRFDLTDAMAIAGIFPLNETNSAASDTDAVLHYDKCKIILGRNDTITISAKNVNINLSADGRLNVAGGNLTVDA